MSGLGQRFATGLVMEVLSVCGLAHRGSNPNDGIRDRPGCSRALAGGSFLSTSLVIESVGKSRVAGANFLTKK